MSNITRRTFLAVTATLAVAGAASTESVAAVAAPTPAPAAPPPNKYKETIRLFDRCVAVGSDSRECSARIGVLLAYMRENFESPPKPNEAGYKEVLNLTRTLLQNKLDIAGIRGIPPNVADSIYPIAIVALGLRSYNLPLDTAFVWNEWDRFHRSYGNYIIESLS